MTVVQPKPVSMKRPRILVRAARSGLANYKRDRDLRRLLKDNAQTGRTVDRLRDEEMRLEEIRRNGDATYSAERHVGCLTALLAELNLRAA